MACSWDDGPVVESSNVSTDAGDSGYVFPEGVNFNERKYTILNCDPYQWGQICLVTSHELLGVAINDAIYKRTLWLEETLNCTLEEKSVPIGNVQKELDIVIDSGENSYAAAYMQAKYIAAEMMSNRLTQLDYVDSIKLEESYWNQELLKATSINNRHYTAASDAHLQHFEGLWAVFFNTKKLANNGIDYPYDLVRNHEWTWEKFLTMTRQLASLNGDETWDFSVQGRSQYGFSTHWVGISMLLFGVDAQFGQKDQFDMPVLTVENSHFMDRAQMVAEFCSEPGTFHYATPDNTKKDEEIHGLFLNGRVAMAGMQMHAMLKCVQGDVEFGVVPFPLYDENQENYKVSSSVTASYLCIPYGYAYTEDIGLIMDAMSYEADRTLVKVYYEDHLEFKSNNGEVLDNIEMLNFFRENRSNDIVVASGLDSTLHTNICYAIRDGGGELTSTYKTNASATEIKFKKLRIFFGVQ